VRMERRRALGGAAGAVKAYGAAAITIRTK
jgi:hypothetical protein